MRREGFYSSIVIKDDERAFLTRDGRFVELLGPGKYSAFDFSRNLDAEVVKVVRAELLAEKALLLEKTQPKLAEDNLEIVQPGPNEVAIVSFDGEPKHLVMPNTTRAFWKTLTNVDVELIDTATEMRIAKRHLDKIDVVRNPVVVPAIVGAHEAGLLIVDGKMTERLAPGRHAFWAVGRTV